MVEGSMKKEKIYICCRDKKGRCGDFGGEQLAKRLEEELALRPDLQVKVKKSDCLGACKKGIACWIKSTDETVKGLTPDSALDLVAVLASSKLSEVS